MNKQACDEFTKKVRDTYLLPRSKTELYTWVDDAMGKWSSFAHQCENRKEWRNSFSSENSRFWKKFFDEARPLSQLITHTPDFSGEFAIQLFLDSRSPDAKLLLNDGRELYVEITTPRDGDLENQQQLCLEEFGRAPTYVQGGANGYKIARETGCAPEGQARRTDEIFSESVRELQEAISKKCKNSLYKVRRPCVLLIAVYDNKFFNVLELAEELAVPQETPFQSIYLLGQYSLHIANLVP